MSLTVTSASSDKPAASPLSDEPSSPSTDSPSAADASPRKWDKLWLVLALVALCLIYRDVFVSLSNVWSNNADYSHGYLVPIFAAYILWSNRGSLHRSNEGNSENVLSNSGLVLGASLLGAGLLMRLAGIYMRIQTLEGISIVPFILGAITILYGRRAARWGAPAVLFLLFMIPLPGILSGQLSGLLQTIATQVSTFSFQTLGIPAFAEGNVITLSKGQIGVAEACSGLRMLYAFFALTVGACMMINRTWTEKVVIGLSAIPIAIVANCIRIIATGIAFEYFDPEIAEHVFHDVAGWLMMPLGFAILLGVLGILDRLIVPDDRFPIQSGLR